MNDVLSEWGKELEATGKRVGLERVLKELDEIRTESAAPHTLRITGDRSAIDNLQPAVTRFLTFVTYYLEGRLTTDTDDAPLLFLETLEFGSIRREVLKKLAVLAAGPAPLLLLVVTIPPRPPSAQRAILDGFLAKVRAERIPLLSVAVCDPEAAEGIERSAREVAESLQRLRTRRLRDRLLRAHRRLIVDLRVVAASMRLDLQSIDTSIRRIQHDKEMMEARLERAVRAMRAHLVSELPLMTPQIVDRMHDEQRLLADAVIRDQRLFATTLERIAHDAIESVLSETLPVVVARAVEIYSERAAQEADTIAGASGEALQAAANLSAESLVLAAHVEADDVVHLIRWHDQIATVLKPVIRKNPKLAIIETLIDGAAKLYIANTITETIDQLQEPLQQNLTHLAGVLADRTAACLLRLSREPIDTLESALQAERQRQLSARDAAIPAVDIAAAMKHHENLIHRMQEWNGD